MLPSRGFFKKNDCPFFEKGLCVRPHCHFRHRKKVVSENSSSVDSQEDLLISESLADIPIVNSINSESVPVSTSSTPKNETEHSTSTADSKGDQSSHSLFAKLVNESNPYERISRHIPCAYTPTPQIRSAQPKNRTVVAKNSINSAASIDLLNKNQTFINSCKSVNSKQSDSKYVPSQELELNSLKTNTSNNSEQSSKYSVNSHNNSFATKDTGYKTSLFENKHSEIPSYEPQLTTKSIGGNLDQTDSCISNYVPSKVTSSESKYIPSSNEPTLSNDYVPSKEKPKRAQYVPEPTGNIKNQVTYTPSEKTSGETQYQPGKSNCVADYVPTEKSATKSSSSSWLTSDAKNDLTEFEYISSEIELMKELLKDEMIEKKETDETISKTETSEDNEKEKKSKEKEKSSRSHHSSSSRHRSESSSHSHSSSLKSKHSSSSSSKHSSCSSSSSRRHSSSSSKHHSSSSNSKRCDSHKSSSKSHNKSSSSAHKSSRHHSSHKFHDKSKGKSTHSKSSSDKERKEKRHSEKKKVDDKKSGSSDDEVQNAEDFASEEESTSGGEEESESESEMGSKKRKSTWSDDERKIKLLKKVEEDLFDDLDDDPDTVEKQCLEIFNSYSNKLEANAAKKSNEVSVPAEDYESSVPGKKRTAHATSVMSDHSVLRHKTIKKLNTIKSAQEVMMERYKTIEKTKEIPPAPPPVQPAPILGLNRPSIRIAAVSNIQQMLQAKKAIQEKINQGLKVNERTTIAQTVSRGSSRVAHTPAAKEMAEKPTITVGSKQVPRVKRQIYLDKLLLETNQIYPTKGESAEEAMRLEEEIFQAHSGSSSAYHAAFVSMLLKTRRRIAAVTGQSGTINASRPKVSHSDVLSGGKKNFSIIKTKKVDISMLSDRHIYDELLRCKLTPEELKANGFPVEGGKPGYATCSFNFELKYYDKYLYIKKMTGNRRYCIRCSKQYEVDPVTLEQYKEGPETCCYHPGKKKSGGRNADRVYNCCNTSSTEGCSTHVRHVTDCNDYENYPNCVKTLSKDNETNPGVFALDCEMVYTRLGSELARVTVVNLKKEIVYDTLVKPKYPIECYNTFYSGIEEKTMEGVETTLKDVQAVLLSMFSDKTILIGHSLDSDLRALHLIHDTVVDTAVVYKNEKYHPYKYSLKDLCAKKISKIIQDNVNGHDSAEDAVAALEIMLNHVKEEICKYDSLESYEADCGK